MNRTTKETFFKVCNIIKEVYDLNFIDPYCNERYLHHYFSQRIKESFSVIYEDYNNSTLHPEWATANKVHMNGGRYRKKDNKYFVKDAGTSGFVDFALGKYKNPALGIEFKVCDSWKSESLIFDYMKLMDRNNSIKSSISFAVIFRESRFSNKLNINTLNNTLLELENRLNERLDTNRKFLFWIVEVALKSQEKRSWYCDNLSNNFSSGIPVIPLL